MHNSLVYQIAIDGPAGSGKSCIAKLVAKSLGFQFINTGGMFRCYAIALKDTDLSNEHLIKQVLQNSKVELKGALLFLNGVDVTEQANSNEISMLASRIAIIKSVRQHCLVEQRLIASKQSCVMEGRDTTSVVLPNATLKIFLTASPEVRAKRRWLQSGQKLSLEKITEDLKQRDYQDINRKIAPLVFTPGCIKVDTDNLTIDEVVELIIQLFKKEVGNV